MVLVDNVGRHAMEAADKSKTEGIIEILTANPNPPEAGKVKVAPETNKQRTKRNVGIVETKGHQASECSKKRADSEKSGSGSSRTEQGNRQWSHYIEGSEDCNYQPNLAILF